VRKKTHDAFAREIARILHLDEDKVLLGARLPDFDKIVGVHRRTFHNAVALAGASLLSPDVFVGFLSHLILDLFPSRFEGALKFLEGFEEDVS